MNFWIIVLAVFVGEYAVAFMSSIIRVLIDRHEFKKQKEAKDRPSVKPIPKYTTFANYRKTEEKGKTENDIAAERYLDLQIENELAGDLIDQLKIMRMDCEILLDSMQSLYSKLKNEKSEDAQ